MAYYLNPYPSIWLVFPEFCSFPLLRLLGVVSEQNLPRAELPLGSVVTSFPPNAMTKWYCFSINSSKLGWIYLLCKPNTPSKCPTYSKYFIYIHTDFSNLSWIYGTGSLDCFFQIVAVKGTFNNCQIHFTTLHKVQYSLDLWPVSVSTWFIVWKGQFMEIF